MRILPVVEGYGDVQAVPILLRKILHSKEAYDCEIVKPFRAGDFWRVRRGFSDLLRQLAKENTSVLVLLDCDDDCAVQQRDQLLAIAPNDISIQFEIAFLVREYESLFLCDHTTSKKVLQIREDVEFPAFPQDIRDAKGWLSKHMPQGVSYKETIHQEIVTARLQLDVLERYSSSYQHLDRCISRLLKNN